MKTWKKIGVILGLSAAGYGFYKAVDLTMDLRSSARQAEYDSNLNQARTLLDTNGDGTLSPQELQPFYQTTNTTTENFRPKQGQLESFLNSYNP